jgi:tRNA (guanine-N7-)-methyltransferase
MYESFSKIFLNSRDFCSGIAGPLFESFPKRIVEIGFGNGDYLAHLAERHGSRTLVVGLEVSAVCVLKATKRLAARNLLNSRVIMGDARFVLENCFPAESVATIYMNFPCPWPKTRHSSRRVTYGRFPAILSRVLEDRGEFRLVTDEEWYAIEVKNSLSSHTSLEFVSLEVDPVLELTTKYASKWKAMGKRTFRLTMKKIGPGLETGLKKVEESMAMHTKISLNETEEGRIRAETLVGKHGSDGFSHWSFKSIYWSPDRHALLKTITSDEGFEQTFFFRLVFTEGSLLVKLEDAGAPLHTPSVSLAMEALSVYFREKR